MRVIFSVVGLLVAVLIVGLLAKQQLRAVQPPAAGASSGAAAPPAQAQALQRQTVDEVTKALAAGMQRNRDAEGTK